MIFPLKVQATKKNDLFLPRFTDPPQRFGTGFRRLLLRLFCAGSVPGFELFPTFYEWAGIPNIGKIA